MVLGSPGPTSNSKRPKTRKRAFFVISKRQTVKKGSTMKVSLFYIKRLMKKAYEKNINPLKVLATYEHSLKDLPQLTEKQIADHMSEGFDDYDFDACWDEEKGKAKL